MAGVLRTPTTATPRALSASGYESLLSPDATGALAGKTIDRHRRQLRDRCQAPDRFGQEPAATARRLHDVELAGGAPSHDHRRRLRGAHWGPRTAKGMSTGDIRHIWPSCTGPTSAGTPSAGSPMRWPTT